MGSKHIRKRPEFRPATRKDIELFYPSFPKTFRAWVVEVEGETLGVGGVYYDGEYSVAFSSFKPELDRYPLVKARGAKKIMDIVRDRACLAIADERFPGSKELLERLGFQNIEGRIYKWTPQRHRH